MIKKALLTGSTGGLGKEIAQILAEDGWDLILLNRNKDQSDKQIASLQSEFPDQTFDSFLANLMDLDDIRKITQDIAETHPKITALYNIAGILSNKRIINPQEIEGHFALNTLAPYMISKQLQLQLKAGATQGYPACIIYFSSSAINSVKELNVDKLVNPDKIGGLMDAYAKTKAALNVIACFLREEFLADNIYIYTVDPGATKTQMTTSNKGMPWFLRILAPLLFSDPRTQAEKLVNGIHTAQTNEKTGLFISSGKVKENPVFTNDIKIQNDLRELMDNLIQSN